MPLQTGILVALQWHGMAQFHKYETTPALQYFAAKSTIIIRCLMCLPSLRGRRSESWVEGAQAASREGSSGSTMEDVDFMSQSMYLYLQILF